MGFLNKIFKSDNDRQIAKLEKIAKLVDDKEEYYKSLSNEDLQNTTKVYVKFDNNNIDLSNVTVKTSNIANLALVDNGNKSVIMLESASKVTHNGTNYYGFDVIGLKEGSFVLTISAPNGYLEEISGKVVKVGGNLSFNPDSENNADIFYKNENIIT